MVALPRLHPEGKALRAIVTLASLLFVALTLFCVLEWMPNDTLLGRAYRIRLESDSLAFFGPNLTSAVFWVEPFDDAFDTGGTPRPLMNRYDYRTQPSA